MFVVAVAVAVRREELRLAVAVRREELRLVRFPAKKQEDKRDRESMVNRG